MHPPQAVHPEEHSLDRLLLVEDDPSLRLCVRFYLQKHGWEVTAVSSVPEATYLLEEEGPFDLIVTDFKLRLPQTGLDLLAYLSASDDPTAAIMMSGNTDPSLATTARALGAVECLVKPVPLKGLARICWEALGRTTRC
jgi:two-component system, LuxR family, response regulator FixJ